MRRTRPSATLSKARERIASEVRSLRNTRGWTLEELAKHLAISKSRLSDIERGEGSFTAEQFLEILALFNVTATHFAPPSRDAADQLQNALARFGAASLYESGDTTPSEHLRSVQQVIREALIEEIAAARHSGCPGIGPQHRPHQPCKACRGSGIARLCTSSRLGGRQHTQGSRRASKHTRSRSGGEARTSRSIPSLSRVARARS